VAEVLKPVREPVVADPALPLQHLLESRRLGERQALGLTFDPYLAPSARSETP
jgi:hypothetical protein